MAIFKLVDGTGGLYIPCAEIYFLLHSFCLLWSVPLKECAAKALILAPKPCDGTFTNIPTMEAGGSITECGAIPATRKVVRGESLSVGLRAGTRDKKLPQGSDKKQCQREKGVGRVV